MDTSLTGRAPEVRLGKSDCLSSSSPPVPSDGWPIRRKDFWNAWTCSLIEWAIAVLLLD